MLGYQIAYIILFLLSVFLIIKGERKYSTLCFLIFVTKGLSLLPAEAGFIKATHLAFFYCIIFCIINATEIRLLFTRDVLVKRLFYLLVFFMVSIVVSILYFQIPISMSIISGSRYLILVSFCFFFFLSKKDKQWLIKVLFYITLVVSIIFIIQAFTGLHILVASQDELGSLDAHGFYHFRKGAAFASLFLYIALFDNKLFPKYLRWFSALVFAICLIATMYRVLIFTTFLTIVLILLSRKASKKSIVIVFLLMGITYIFQSQLMSDVQREGVTKSDLTYIIKGDFKQTGYHAEGGYTMLYRFAWMKERINRVVSNPIELLFGLGLTTDNKWATQKYHFKYGVLDNESMQTSQIRTSDIGWGNFITCYGLIGTLIFFYFYYTLIKRIRRYKEKSEIARIMYYYLLTALILMFSSMSVSEPYNFVPIFFMLAYIDGFMVIKKWSVNKDKLKLLTKKI